MLLKYPTIVIPAVLGGNLDHTHWIPEYYLGDDKLAKKVRVQLRLHISQVPEDPPYKIKRYG